MPLILSINIFSGSICNNSNIERQKDELESNIEDAEQLNIQNEHNKKRYEFLSESIKLLKSVTNED